MSQVVLKRRGVELVLFGATIHPDRIEAEAVYASAPVGSWQVKHETHKYRTPAIPRRGFFLARITLPRCT